jgi:hypothetical protein
MDTGNKYKLKICNNVPYVYFPYLSEALTNTVHQNKIQAR